MRDQRHDRSQHGRDRGRRATSGNRTARRPGRAAGRSARQASGPPPFQPPQLATLVDAVPSGNDWLHEYKYDGYRLLVSTAGGAATAWTRNGKDWSDKFRSIVRAAAKLPAGCLIDGEAVALDKKGKPSFQLLQATLQGRRRRTRLLRLRPAGRPGRGHHRPAQYRAQGAAGGAAQGRQPADPLWRPCHRQGRGAVRGHLHGRRRGDHLEEGQGALRRRRGRTTGSRSNASSGRNSSSSAGRTATSARASARSSSRRATAAS